MKNRRCKQGKRMVCNGETDGLYGANRPSVFYLIFREKVNEL